MALHCHPFSPETSFRGTNGLEVAATFFGSIPLDLQREKMATKIDDYPSATGGWRL